MTDVIRTADEHSVRKAAELAVLAFDMDDNSTWIRGREACQDPPNTALGKLLKAMRKAWWHGGTYKEREAVHVAAARLRFRLQWDEEQTKEKRRAA
jgi:hypothetical protein